jgi:hypothetical protein
MAFEILKNLSFQSPLLHMFIMEEEGGSLC